MFFETCTTSNSTLTNHLASIFIACEWFWVASVALVIVIVLLHVASSAAKVVVDTQLGDGTCIQRFALAVRHYVHRRRTVTRSIIHRVYLLVPNRLTPPATPRTEAHRDAVRVQHAPIVEGGGELRNVADAATLVPPPPRAANNAIIVPEDEAPEMVVHGVPIQMRYPIPVQVPLPLTQDQDRLMRCPDVVMLLMNALEEEFRQQEDLCLVYPHFHNPRGGGTIRTFLFTVTMRHGGDSLLRLERIKCLLTHCVRAPHTIVLPRNIACTAFEAMAGQCLVSVVHLVLFDDASPIHHNPGGGTAVVVGSPSAISLLINAIDACSNPLAAPT
jgi:hypothetical protein